jgi:two-component system OmpR family sensor kinase
MFTSLRSRLWLTYALIIGVVVVIVGAALVVYLIRNPYQARLENQYLQQSVRLLTATILQRGEALLSANPQQAQAAVERADQALGVRVLLYTAGGELLADSRSDQAVLAFPPGIRLGVAPTIRDTQGRRWQYAVNRLPGDFLLMVARPRARIPVLSIIRNEFITPYLQAIAVALVLGLVLAFWIARWVSGPLDRMAETARNLAASRATSELQPVMLEGPQEVRTLGRAFNAMVARVQASQRSQRDFVANVSHELKTPLTSIQGFAQAIVDGTAESPQALQQAAQVIFTEAGRMHRMVVELLDLARLDSGIANMQRQPVDLVALAASVLEKFSPLAEQAGVKLTFHSEGREAFVDGDRDRLSQVFTNLVDNALRHTPSGGQVAVQVQRGQEEVKVAVADSGPGIPAGELERIFERFYQTDKSRQAGEQRGFGLGLAIAREIVLAHNGSITAHSQGNWPLWLPDFPRQGSVFVVKLPLANSH